MKCVLLLLSILSILSISSILSHIDGDYTLICPTPDSQNCTLLPRLFVSSYSLKTTIFLSNLFSYFWSTQFILGVSTMTIAGTIGHWYFRKGDAKSSEQKHVLLNALACTLCYHMGSVALGSCLFATIQFVRMCIL